MILVPGGHFVMGSDAHYPEERPAHEVEVDDFLLARAPVTNAEFAAFVDATGYLTVAERPPDPVDYPGVPADRLVPGSAVFRPPAGPVDLADPSAWWVYVAGASWHAPDGPGSDLAGRIDHPVVHVALVDAEAYAAWAGARLPTEPEWERAAAGSVRGNVWRGDFPWRHEGIAGTTPAGSFPANPLGVVDLLGNVWEWTATRWASHPAHTAHPGHTGSRAEKPCCGASDPAAPTIPLHVTKGGSFLCSERYCARYRPAARMAMAVDSGSSNVGFRVARDP